MAWRQLVGTSALVIVGGCADDFESICETVGREGALLTSLDRVLTIAISPESVDDPVEVCIAESRSAPEIDGPAYRVRPSFELAYDATVTYRHALPSDSSEINIGHVDGVAYAAGNGAWASLRGCRVQASARLVRCFDDQISAYYGLLDGLVGSVDEGIADTGDGTTGIADTGPSTLTTTMSTTVDPTVVDDSSGPDPTDTDPTDTDPTDPTGGIEYPPECEDLMPGPFEAIDHGQVVETEDASPPLGSEDLAMDGNGGLVMRSGNTLRRFLLADLDADNTTPDPTFNPPTFTSPTLGMRYAGADLLLMQRTSGRVEIMTPDYTVDTLFTQPAAALANGVSVDDEGMIWTTFYLNRRLIRFDRSAKKPEPEIIATADAAPQAVVHDRLRGQLFYLTFSDGSTPSRLWRIPISASGDPGQAVQVTDLDGYADGLGIDVCGNLYIVDQGGATDLSTPNDCRVDRLFLDDGGDLDDIVEILDLPDSEISNIAWGDGDFATTVYMTGQRGHIYSMDVGIGGAPTGAGG